MIGYTLSDDRPYTSDKPESLDPPLLDTVCVHMDKNNCILEDLVNGINAKLNSIIGYPNPIQDAQPKIAPKTNEAYLDRIDYQTMRTTEVINRLEDILTRMHKLA